MSYQNAGCVLTSRLLIQFLGSVPDKPVKNIPSTWVRIAQVGDQDGVLGPVLDIVAILRCEPADGSLSLCLSALHTLPFK